ncbi:hypothetical protein HDU92_005749, partial [Lobulomyces angularis]
TSIDSLSQWLYPKFTVPLEIHEKSCVHCRGEFFKHVKQEEKSLQKKFSNCSNSGDFYLFKLECKKKKNEEKFILKCLKYMNLGSVIVFNDKKDFKILNFLINTELRTKIQYLHFLKARKNLIFKVELNLLKLIKKDFDELIAILKKNNECKLNTVDEISFNFDLHRNEWIFYSFFDTIFFELLQITNVPKISIMQSGRPDYFLPFKEKLEQFLHLDEKYKNELGIKIIELRFLSFGRREPIRSFRWPIYDYYSVELNKYPFVWENKRLKVVENSLFFG